MTRSAPGGGSTILTADYTYYANGQVETITYGNGAVVEYEYDDAERLSVIRHKESTGGATILELGYEYNPRGLITQIDESGSGGAATVSYDYDKRGRLIAEKREETHPYWLEYTYDLGGNRKTKVQKDESGEVLYTTTYHYDTDDDGEDGVDCNGDGWVPDNPPVSAADCYNTRNNRLMYYVVTDGLGARRELVQYQYELGGAADGNPNRIVRTTWDLMYNPPKHYDYTLQYDGKGELWFITQQHWTGTGCNDAETVSCQEYRSSGRNMRLTTKRDPQYLDVIEADSRVWHDYDGEDIYADVGVGFDEYGNNMTVTELAGQEPGTGAYDRATAESTYHHGDQIGSTRVVTTQPSGDKARIVYTAFGERVGVDGAIGTRYQYAGAYGYQTMPEYASGFSNGFGGTPGDEVPFIHVGHRWYDPSTGRFLQRDPIGIEGGLNMYAYVRNRPTNLIDPLGDDAYPNQPPVIIYDDVGAHAAANTPRRIRSRCETVGAIVKTWETCLMWPCAIVADIVCIPAAIADPNFCIFDCTRSVKNGVVGFYKEKPEGPVIEIDLNQ